MSFVRPEVATWFRRWREVIAAAVVACGGLWLAAQGGPLLAFAGGIAAAAGFGLCWVSLRRARFARAVTAPGIVEVDEGQIGWYGPGIGGFVAQSELSEIGLVTVSGMRCWRLRQTDGQLLLIPVAASGTERLFDAFAALPGIDTALLVTALNAPADRAVIWRRDRHVALT